MSEPSAELRQLADRYWQRLLTPAETERFNELLRDDATAQRWFLAQAGIHARWQWEFAQRSSAPLCPATPRRRSMRWAVAASLTACAAVLAWFFWPAPPTPPSLATLGNVTDARWSATVPQPGDPLGPGRLSLRGGVAEVQFNNGAVAILEGPSELELIAADHAFLHAGQVVLRVPPAAVGFRLDTPKARLLDLGTEFGVRVGDVGETFVQVYEGEVLASAKASLAEESRLESGQAMLIDHQTQEAPFYPERFIRYLPGPEDPRGRGVYPYNQARHEELHIVPAPKGVAIDGGLEDWDLSGQFHSACEPPYGEHYYVRGAMMYDDQCLYIGGHVGDPFPLRSTVSPHVQREHYGNGGSVAFRLSLDRAMGWPVRGEHKGKRKSMTPVDTNDKLVFLVLWHYRPENQPCMHIRYGMDMHDVRVNPPGYRGAFRPAADGYTFEYAIPWSLLHAAADPPQGGDVLGATWLVHWSEPEGRVWKGQLIDVVNPRETGWNFQRAATWGRAIYRRQGQLPPGTVKTRE